MLAARGKQQPTSTHVSVVPGPKHKDAAKLNLRRRWDVKPPTNRAQPFMWLSAVRLRSTMLRRDVGNSIAAESSKDVSVRETVSMVKPR